MYEALSPVGQTVAEPAHPCRRLPDLRGKTIGMVSNGMFKSEFTLNMIGELLQKRYLDIKFIPYTEFPIQPVWKDATTILQRVEDTVNIAMDKGCDAVLVGNAF